MDVMWVGPESWKQDAYPVSPHPALFRRDIQIAGHPTAAALRITAHARYVLYINGKRVAAGPARCYPERQILDPIDILPFLRVGDNALAVYILMPTGATGYSVTARPGLFCTGEITCAGQTIPIATDASWRVRSAEWISNEGFFLSLPVGMQEHTNLAHAPADALTGSLEHFTPVRVMGPAGTPPYTTLETRPIPLLTESPLTPRLIYSGACDATRHAPSTNLARQLSSLKMMGHRRGPSPTSEVTLDTAADNIVTLDFGRARMIRPAFEITQAQGDCRIELYYDLAFRDKPTTMQGFGSAREGFCDSLSAPAAGVHFSTLLPRGFRFLTLRLSGSGQCHLHLRCQSVDYPFSEARQPPTRDPVLARIWRASCDTLRSAANDVFVDTCTRENVLWTLDACLAGKAAFDSFGEMRLWRRCLSLIAQGINASGIPHAVVPSQDSFMILFDQTMYFVISCRDYAERTGDHTLIPEVWPAIQRFLTLCLKHMTSEDLFVPPAYSWHFVDWAPIPKRAYSFPINAMLALALDAAAAMRPNESRHFIQASAVLKMALKRFWDPEAGCYRNHIEPIVQIGPQTTFNAPTEGTTLTHGVHANALALHCGLGTEPQRESTARWIADRLSEPFGPPNTFGPGWTELILDPLFAYGFGASALDFVKRAYGQALDVGAPTWGEGFSADQFNTAHGWGAIVNSLLARHLRAG